MRRALVTLLIIVAAIGAAAASVTAWVLYTPGGLTWALGQAGRMSEGALTLTHDSGTLGSGALFSRARYDTPALTVNVERLKLRVSPLSLLRLAPHVSEVSAAEVHIATRPADEPARPLEVMGLPVALRIDRASVEKLIVEHNGERTELEQLSLGYDGGPSAHRLREGRLRFRNFAVEVRGTVGTVKPFAVEAKASVAGEAATRRIVARASATGSLEKLALEVDAESAGARLRAEGELVPGAELPLTRLEAVLSGADLRALDDTLPQTAIAGTLALRAANGAFAGTVQLTNALSGPYDTGRLPLSGLRGALRTDFTRAELDDLVIELGAAGELSGSAALHPEKATLSFTTRNLDLRGLHGRLQRTALAGQADATLTPERQSVTADMRQREMQLKFHAARAGDTVELLDAVARARGGEARAQGKVVLTDRQPFSARVRFNGFDPAAWGDFPRGSISGKLAGHGTIEGPRATIDFALDKSRLHDAPLAGRGNFSLAGDRLSGVDLELRLGPNRAQASGAFGGRNDTLRLRVDAPHLATFDPRLGGRVKGEAHLSGSLKSPRVRFDASGEALAAANVRIERARAEGAYGSDPSAPLRLTARVTGLIAAERRVATLNLDLEGTQAAHTAAARATGERFDVAARLRGGWAPQHWTWSGTLLEFSNRGTLDVVLESAVALSAAPEKVTVGRLGLKLMDGRLDAEESRYDHGTLFSKGRFSRLPAGEIARVTGAPAIGGTLRISGAWSLVQEKALTGSVTVTRDSGDLVVGTARRFPLQLETLALEGRVGADRLEYRAVVKSALASAEAQGTVGIVATDEGARITPASSLQGTARLTVAQLGALASLTDAPLLVEGALAAALTVRGTVGEPAVTGDITGDALGFALPPHGIDLKSGSVRAALTGRALRVDSFSIRGGEGTLKARGNLALKEGEPAAIDWQADHLLLLGRPDRRLIVSGKGRAGLADRKLSLSGSLRAEEGYFEIAPDALPKPGDDVIVAGREPAVKEDAGFTQALLDLIIDFGNRLQIRGRGLDARLAGEITVGSDGDGRLQAKGTVRTVRGTYTAFGQRLDIERGELIFSGPIENPGLDILAMRKRQAVEAGVAVTGTLRSPFARVVSDPPVSESEAISWLVLGHGTSDASRGDLAMLPLAAGSLFGDENAPTLAQRFGLDTLGLRGAGTERQFVTAGKRVADRLYVGFEQSLGAAASILKLEFDLTRRILLRAQTGETNAVGIFYRYSFD